jgi:hypothetical protein
MHQLSLGINQSGSNRLGVQIILQLYNTILYLIFLLAGYHYRDCPLPVGGCGPPVLAS